MPHAAEETTLTTARQSSQLLQLLRSVLRGNMQDLIRYLDSHGDPNARVYQGKALGSFHVSSEEYTGPGAVVALSLLAMCCFKKRTEQAALLINAGADLDSDAGTAVSPMCSAALRGYIPSMSLLHSKGAQTDCDDLTPLMMSCEAGKLEAVKWLVDHGADVAHVALVPCTVVGLTSTTSPMLRAAVCGHLDVLRFLHAHSAPFVAILGGQMRTALHEAAGGGHAECVRFILACGFAVVTKETGGHTALHTAAERGRTSMIELLLNSGVDIEAKDANEFAPLTRAMSQNQCEAVTCLIARGAVINDGVAAGAGAAYGSIAAFQALVTSPRWLAMSRAERFKQSISCCIQCQTSALWMAYAVSHQTCLR